MPSTPYSFIDVAILDGVRERFASGDAVVILAADLNELIWANGPGALLFGYEDIEAVGGAESGLSYASKRQITGTSGYPRIGSDRGVVLRLARGLESRAYAFLASEITLPDGEEAIMLSIPAGLGAREEDIAGRAIGGFAEPGHFVAFIDGRGGIEAASPDFDTLGISTRTLADLAAEAGRAAKRVVKKVISARQASLPAGIARLRDEPARHLLVVVDERRATPVADWTTPHVPPAPRPPPVIRSAIQPPAVRIPVVEAPVAVAAIVPAIPVQTSAFADADATPPIQAATPEPHRVDASAADVAAPRSAPRGLIEDLDELPPAKADGQQDAEAAPDAAFKDQLEIEVDRAAAPLRFAWRTDAQGRFSAISAEFVWAVGEQGTDVLGRHFREVAGSRGLDPYSEIADLLERRDTWSGRSVLWPVAGTDLRVPVDLAALPVYGRDRSFEGFHGFGVARMGDAIVDSEAPRAAPADDEARAALASDGPSGGQAADIAADDDPFRGETPALAIAPKPDRRASDKVVKFLEHRNGTPEKSLSPVERSAFREIGERLRPEDGEANRTATDDAKGDAASIEPPRFDTNSAAAIVDAKAEETTPPVRPNAILDEAETPALDTVPEPQAVDMLRDRETFDIRPGEQSSGDPSDTPTESSASVGNAAMPLPPAGDDAATAPLTKPIAVALPPAEPPHVRPPAPKTAPAPLRGDARPARPDVDARPARDAGKATRPTSADLLAEGFLPSAFSGPSAQPRKPIQDTPILSRLPVPLLVHSGDVLHYANDEFLSLTGYDSVDQLAQAGGLGALFSERYDEPGSVDGDDRAVRLKTRDGLEFAIEALLRSVPWNGGKALMLVVRRTGDDDSAPTTTPIPAQAPAPGVDPLPPVDTSALKARVAEMRTIIDTATDGVILIGNDNTIRSISRPAEALFGFDTDELSGKPFVSLFAIESQRAARDYLVGLSDNGVASVLNDGREVIGREAQGRFIPLFMTIGKLPNESGYCAVVRDITQWKRAEEELTQAKALAERASSQKTDFLARVSHEIRTPLNAIIGFSELMVDERFGPIANERYRDYLRDINRSGNHVLDLVNDLLDISKIEAGEQDMANEAVSLNDTLAETVAMMQPQANRERVIIRSSFASRLPEVVADLRSIRQIALNILANAIRYTQAGGQVIVSTAHELSGDVVMRVRDTGIGMSPAEIEQAMKPFKQINALKRGRGDGTGLGLPLTKAMVEANRARFTINSSPGDGTMVEVIFPSTRVLAD